VLFIAVDDLNDWVRVLRGHPQVQTPNIDRLAAGGIVFTNAHCAAPACNPSRAAVFSGRMAYNTGVWSNESPRLLKQFPLEKVLTKVLSRAGYQTFGTGKLLHSASANKSLFEQSFNPEQRWSPFTREQVRYTADELPSKGTDNPRHLVRMADGDEVVLPLNRMPSDRNPEGTDGESFDWGPLDVPDDAMGDTQITDWAIDRLKDRGDEPFFLGVGYYRPHIPLWAPRRYFDRFEGQKVILPVVRENDLEDLSIIGRRWALEPVTAGSHATVLQYDQWPAAVEAYLACVTFVDHQIGRLLDVLESRDLASQTMIVLWSDHGWHLGEKQHWGKWTPWERSTRVPLIIVPPRAGAPGADYAPAGSSCHQPVSLIDMYPTIADICGITPPEGLDGVSLVPLLKNPTQATGRAVVTTFDPGNVSVRTDRFRYIRYADGSEELYDHKVDPHEWTNLSSDPNLQATLVEMRKRVPSDALDGPRGG
jgi:arylsulfatase A-like enzyme